MSVGLSFFTPQKKKKRFASFFSQDRKLFRNSVDQEKKGVGEYKKRTMYKYILLWKSTSARSLL